MSSIKKNITFKKDKNLELKADFYFDEITEDKVPVIILLHGGALKIGNDKTQNYIVDLAKRLSMNKFKCFSIDYRVRRNPESDYKGTITDAVEDLEDFIIWMKQNSEEYKIDIEKIIILGGSAGGWVSNNYFLKSEKIDQGIKVFINLWGTPSEEQKIGSNYCNFPPLICIHGTSDKIVPFSQSMNLIKEVKLFKISNEIYPIIGADHTPIDRIEIIEELILNFLKKTIK